MQSNPMSADVTDNDRLWAALSYVFTPIVSIIVLLIESTKTRPFIKYHGVQSLILGVVVYVLLTIISIVTFGLGACLCIVPIVLQLYYAYRAYQGAYFEIPMLTNFAKQQGWL